MSKYHIYGIGNALVDVEMEVSEQELARLSIEKGVMTLVDEDVPCSGGPTGEQATRAFVNLLMVALATDYKKDQIHLPEILKRLR